MVAQVDFKYIIKRPTKLISRLISYAFFEGRPLTTKGRWINPLVFGIFKLAKLFPALQRVSGPIFILGTGRSGTTVLGVVLSMHRDVGFLNEPKALWHAIHSGEDLIGSYSLEKAHYRLDKIEATYMRRKWIHRIFGAYLAATFSKRVVDKYPELIFRVPFVQALFPDAKFIFLIRNGWDTCRSIQLWSNRLGEQINEDVHDWWGVNRRKWYLLVEQIVPEHPDLINQQSVIRNFNNQTDMAAVEWIVSMREGLSLLKKHPKEVISIKFEELSQQPGTSLQKLCNFLQLGEDPVFMSYGEQTLHQVQDAGTFELHPSIVGPFNETMKKLGYV